MRTIRLSTWELSLRKAPDLAHDSWLKCRPRRVTLQMAFAVFCVTVFGQASEESVEKSRSATVTDLGTGKSENLGLLIRRLFKAIDAANPSRRDFESVSAFEERQRRNRANLERLLQRRFRLSTAPDCVSLDWANSAVTIQLDLPIDVYRERGGSRKTSKLSFVARLQPDQARVVSSFPDEVLVRLDFRFSTTKAILLTAVRIIYHNREIYRE